MYFKSDVVESVDFSNNVDCGSEAGKTRGRSKRKKFIRVVAS